MGYCNSWCNYFDALDYLPTDNACYAEGSRNNLAMAFRSLYVFLYLGDGQLRGIFTSLLLIFLIALVSNVISNISFIKNDLGLEVVFFAVLVGLLVRNTVGVPEWMKPAIQSEFYIKIGIICLGSTILFGDIMRSGAYGLLQSLIVVISVWYFAFWLGKKFKVDSEMGTMLASAVSICGVSAAIATCGVIKGDNKKLSYVISLVLIIAVPMMYILPWVAGILGLDPEVTGAWLGGSIDTTGAVAAAGTLADHSCSTAAGCGCSQSPGRKRVPWQSSVGGDRQSRLADGKGRQRLYGRPDRKRCGGHQIPSH